MAGYGEDKFSVVAELRRDEIISLWLHYRNKNAYAISQEGTLLRDGDTLKTRVPRGNVWTPIAWRNEDGTAILITECDRRGLWEGPVRSQIRVAVEDHCGQNGATISGVTEYILPREQRPDITKEDEERITGISLINNSLRVTTANGITNSYRLERLFHQQYPLGIYLPEDRPEDKIEVSFHVSGHEQQYDATNDRLPKPVTKYWHPDGEWRNEPFRIRPRFGIHPSGEPYTPTQMNDEEADESDDDE